MGGTFTAVVLVASVSGRLEAQAAGETALMDLNGKALGIPAHRLLGGAGGEASS